MNEPKKLLNKNFILLWQGQFVSRIGSQVFLFVMILWIKNTYHSTSLVGILGMTAGIPSVILSAIGGAVADRYSRRKIIIWSDFLNGITIVAFAALFFIIPGQLNALIAALFVVSLLSSSISAFFGPAISAAIPDIVPEKKVAGANSLGQLSMQISQVVGYGAGNQLLIWLGAPVLTLINGLTFIFSAISEMFAEIPQEIPEKTKSIKDQIHAFKTDIMDGLKYIMQNAGLKHLVFVSVFMAFLSTPVLVLLPFFVEDFLLASDDWIGFMLIAYGVGTSIGYLIVGVFRMSGETRKNLLILFMILESTTAILLGFCHTAYQAIIVLFVEGLFSGFIVVSVTTLLQITTPSKIRGRVFGVVSTIAGSIAPLGMALSGVVADLIDQNIPIIFIGSGVLMVALSVLVSLSPHFRKFAAYESDREPAATGFHYSMHTFNSSEIYQSQNKQTTKESS